MAYYDESGGDSQFSGRFNKNFDGPVGPRRPSTFPACDHAVNRLPPKILSPTNHVTSHRTCHRLRVFDGTMDANTSTEIPWWTPHGSGKTERQLHCGCELRAACAWGPRFRLAEEQQKNRPLTYFLTYRWFLPWVDPTLRWIQFPCDTYINLSESRRNRSSWYDGLPRADDY